MKGSSQIVINGMRKTFIELAMAIKDAMLIMGYNPKIEVIQEQGYKRSTKDVNIYIKEPPFNITTSSTNILIQTEQTHITPLIRPKAAWTKILDLFPSQCSNKNTIYFPLGYSPHFDTIHNSNIPQKHDLLFFGSLYNKRFRHRKIIIDKFKITHVILYGAVRDKLIAQTKLNVIINMTNPYNLPPLHALLILCKGKMCLQEYTNDIQLNVPYNKFVTFYTLDNLQDIINDLLPKTAYLIEQGKHIQKTLKQEYLFTSTFIKCVKGTI